LNEQLTSEKADFEHIPVLRQEVLDLLLVKPGPLKIIDATVGYGGHSSLMLKKNAEAVLLGIDRDSEALASSEKILSFAGARIHLVKDSFSNLGACAAGLGWHSVDALLLDLGVSSPQIDNPKRGFSYRLNGPLDMRMDGQSRETACRILNTFSYDALERIFREYGEIIKSRKLAEEIVVRRAKTPWMYTAELAELCNSIPGVSRRGGPPAPSLCFQALRIEVNKELEELTRALESGVSLLAKGGRIAAISFHSLEDRIVKQYFKKMASSCLCPPGLPICVCGHKASLKLITKKPVSATEDEISLNRRAAPAKLRVAEKL
jgi:16S rRNA (cytosine1402-N4)-methyltransferase